MSTKVLICDDHAIVRKGLCDLIDDTPDLEIRKEVSRGKDAIRAIREEEFDVVVLDISMPDQNGLDVLKQIKNLRPDVPVLMLSIHPEEMYAIRSLRAGASGYLTKRSDLGDLVTAVRKVARGERYITPQLAEQLASSFGMTDKPPHENLSDREYEVMLSIARGESLNEISGKLNLSASTVSTYRSRVLKKMGLEKNADIIHYAIQNELIET